MPSATSSLKLKKMAFTILGLKILEISKHEAEQFYAVHASRRFLFPHRLHVERTDRRSGPGKRKRHRRSPQADGSNQPGQRRRGHHTQKWASSIEYNAIHGSDAEDTARFELSFFFAGYELAQ